MDDSMRQRRKLPIDKYSLQKQQRQANKVKKRQEQIERGLELAADGGWLNESESGRTQKSKTEVPCFACLLTSGTHTHTTDLFHIYMDSTCFSYTITLTRGQEGERWILYVSGLCKPDGSAPHSTDDYRQE
jgi:hypothetical protein